MDQLLDWLDSHSGSVMALLTLVYAIATVLILIQTRQANKLSERAVKVMGESNTITRKLERARNRPIVVFYVDIRDRIFYAVLKNVGVQPAGEVVTTIDPPMIRGGDPGDELSFCKSAIPILAPGACFEDAIEPTYSYFQREHAPSHTVTLKYKDMLGKEYFEQSVASVVHYRYHATISSETPLDKMGQALPRITNKLCDLSSSTSQLKIMINNLFNRAAGPAIFVQSAEGSIGDAPISAEDREWLAKIAEPQNEGRVFNHPNHEPKGEERERFYEMINRLLAHGYLRRHHHWLVLTGQAYQFLREPSADGVAGEGGSDDPECA